MLTFRVSTKTSLRQETFLSKILEPAAVQILKLERPSVQLFHGAEFVDHRRGTCADRHQEWG